MANIRNNGDLSIITRFDKLMQIIWQKQPKSDEAKRKFSSTVRSVDQLTKYCQKIEVEINKSSHDCSAVQSELSKIRQLLFNKEKNQTKFLKSNNELEKLAVRIIHATDFLHDIPTPKQLPEKPAPQKDSSQGFTTDGNTNDSDSSDSEFDDTETFAAKRNKRPLAEMTDDEDDDDDDDDDDEDDYEPEAKAFIMDIKSKNVSAPVWSSMEADLLADMKQTKRPRLMTFGEDWNKTKTIVKAKLY